MTQQVGFVNYNTTNAKRIPEVKNENSRCFFSPCLNFIIKIIIYKN